MSTAASNGSADDPLILQGMATLEAQGYVIDKWQTVAGSHIFTVSRQHNGKPRIVTIDEVKAALPDVPTCRMYFIYGSVIVR
jgi:hypothetical protein